jgi:hypothetical protein
MENPDTIVRTMYGLSGRGGIRTPVGLSPKPVFKTGAISRSATLPRSQDVPL